MEIRIDTEIMKQMANISLRAKDYMIQAVKAAETVTAHNDWNCVERDQIDDVVEKIKKSNSTVSENMTVFANIVNEVSEKFNEYDKALLSKFSKFDASIGDMYSITPATTVSESQPQIINRDDLNKAMKSANPGSYWEQYHINNMNRSVAVIRFEDAKNILSGLE